MGNHLRTIDKLSNRVAEQRATIEHLRMRLREQTLQTQETAEQISHKVNDVLVLHNAVPEGLTLAGHPVEQNVGTCVALLQGEVEQLKGLYERRGQRIEELAELCESLDD